MKGPVALLRNSIDVFLQNPKLFIGIYLVPGILTLIFTLFTDYQSELDLAMPLEATLMALLWIVLMVAGILMGIAMIHAVMNPAIGIKEAYHAAKPFFWRYVVLSLMIGFVILGGLILLVIPGIIFMVWFSFSYYVLIEEGISGVDAMKRSKSLVSGKWFAVFGRLLVVFIGGIVIGSIFSVLTGMVDQMVGATLISIVGMFANAVVAPISVAYLYLLYKELKQGSVVVNAVSQPESPEYGSSTPNTNAAY